MRKEKINIILPPTWSAVYLNPARLLQYTLQDQGKEVCITEAGDASIADLSIVLGWHLLPDDVVFNHPYIMYQLEPLGIPHWQEKLKTKMSLFSNAVTTWDYADSNALVLNAMGLNTKVVYQGYHPKLEDITHTPFPDYDILFTGFLTERRTRIISALQHHCSVSIQQRWGKDLSEALGRSKFMLNLHQYDLPTPLEQARIAYALNNRCFVISEEAVDNPYPALVTTQYDNIVPMCLYYLHNQRERKQKAMEAFEAFKELKMQLSLSVDFNSAYL